MARQRRGGFRPPELRGTLGTLLRTTLAQAGGLRSALERGAREGRARLDDALAGRRRSEAVAELGEIVLDLIRRGEIEIDQLPEAREVVAHLDELDEAGDEEEAQIAPAPSRSRFDDRARNDRARDKPDGTVSSSKWVAPPRKTAASARVWRPPVEPVEDRPADEITARDHPRAMTKPGKKGGISFGRQDDDDADLAEYMHPDDVPPKDK
ncbi:MAG: hypothetical protein ABJE66_07625 [Deltaproteobacteria bacterium]